jgi:hypothetical protein
MGAGGEVLVAATAASSSGDDNGLVGAGEVVDVLTGVVVEERGYRDFEGRAFACGARAVGAEAVTAALYFVLGVEVEVDRGVGMNLSRRKAKQPLPTLIRILASSMNISINREQFVSGKRAITLDTVRS